MTEGNRRVVKMRHQLARTTEAAEQHERQRWLASLTPEHRARHEPFTWCPECARSGARKLADAVGASMGALIHGTTE